MNLRLRGVAGALLLFAVLLEMKRFRAPVGARVTFLLRGQEKSNQKRRPPRLALAGPPARQVREAGPGFSSGLLPARKGEAIPGLARCAAFPSPPHRRPGAPEKQVRIVRARSTSKSWSAASSQRFGLCLGFCFCALGARCFTWGRYGAAGGYRKVRRMARRDAGQFFAGTGVPSNNPVTRPRTRRAEPVPDLIRECPEGAPSGCCFSLVPFSLGKQRERNSGANRRTKPL